MMTRKKHGKDKTFAWAPST